MQITLSPLAALALSSLALGSCDQIANYGGATEASEAAAGQDIAPRGRVKVEPASPSAGNSRLEQSAGSGGTPPGGVEAAGKLLVLGDSYSASKLWREAFEREFPNLEITYDSVGGSSLADQLERLKLYPETRGWPLLILDGGLTDAKPIATIADIVEYQGARCDLWFYVEPVQRGYANPKAQERRRRMINTVTTHFEQELPGHLIQWNKELRGQAEGTQQDKFDLEDEIMPSSLRADAVHLNERGYGLLAGIIAREIRQSRLGSGCSE